MEKILILYATLTGTTADVATTLTDRLKTELPEYQYQLTNIQDISLDQIREFKTILFGASTWDHGIPPPDGEAFLTTVQSQRPDFSNQYFALFGLGSTAYPNFCTALDIIREDVSPVGGHFEESDFMIDGYPTEEETAKLVKWAKEFIRKTTHP